MKHGLCLALIFLLGCASLTPERINLLIGLATQAAQLGTQIWLEQNPTHRTSFEISIGAFSDAVRTKQTNAVEYLTSLPTATLKGTESEIYISGNRLLVWDDVVGKSYHITNLPPIVSGLKRGLALMPPKLPAVRNRTVKESLTVAEPPLTDAELDAQFEQVKAKLEARTNTVCTVDVQPTPNGASVVTVRWPARPGVYCVQQRDEGSVDWVTFAHSTNAASWTTPWHPSLPLGHWRVVRK